MAPSHRSASSRRTQTSVSAIMPSSPPISIAPAGSGWSAYDRIVRSEGSDEMPLMSLETICGAAN
jgi:hypothetical protein